MNVYLLNGLLGLCWYMRTCRLSVVALGPRIAGAMCETPETVSPDPCQKSTRIQTSSL